MIVNPNHLQQNYQNNNRGQGGQLEDGLEGSGEEVIKSMGLDVDVGLVADEDVDNELDDPDDQVISNELDDPDDQVIGNASLVQEHGCGEDVGNAAEFPCPRLVILG